MDWAFFLFLGLALGWCIGFMCGYIVYDDGR